MIKRAILTLSNGVGFDWEVGKELNGKTIQEISHLFTGDYQTIIVLDSTSEVIVTMYTKESVQLIY